jgi:hypothetical protein
MKRTCGCDPNADSTLLAARSSAGGFGRVTELAQYCAGTFEIDATSLGQFDATRLAAEQLDIKLTFQRFDLLAQWRLLNAKP